jgi:hypothetical protein
VKDAITMSHHRSSDSQGLQTPGDWLLVICFGLFIFAMLVGIIFHDYQPIKLGILFVLGFWVLLLATHEAGHALAARWLGCEVKRIVLGMGWTLGSFRVKEIPVEIRLAPVEGFVQFDPSGLNWPRLGKAFIYFAGPATDLLLGLIALFTVGAGQFGVHSDDYSHILWQSFVLACFAQGILNLIPHSVSTPQGRIPNDGLGILLSLWADPNRVTEWKPPKRPSERSSGSSEEDQGNDDDPADWWKRR